MTSGSHARDGRSQTPPAIQMIRWIDAALALDEVTPATVGRLLAVRLVETDQNPHWAFYEGGPEGPLDRVSLSQARQGPAWNLVWEYSLAQAPHEDEADLSSFGEPQLRVNPDVPPEGTETRVYHYRHHALSIDIWARSRRIRAVGLAPE